MAIEPDYFFRLEFHHIAPGIALMQTAEVHGKAMDGRIDAVRAADIEHGILVPMIAGTSVEQLADHRLGDIGNHIIERAKNRIIGARVAHGINGVKYCLTSVNSSERFRQYTSPLLIRITGDSCRQIVRRLHNPSRSSAIFQPLGQI